MIDPVKKYFVLDKMCQFAVLHDSSPDAMVRKIVSALTILGNPKGSTVYEINRCVASELASNNNNVKLGILRALKKNVIISTGCENRWSLGLGMGDLQVMQVQCVPKKAASLKKKLAPRSKKVSNGCGCLLEGGDSPKKKLVVKKAVPKRAVPKRVAAKRVAAKRVAAKGITNKMAAVQKKKTSSRRFQSATKKHPPK